MNMLKNQEICISKSNYRGTSATSKGNQEKWNINNLWLKSDSLGYEGLAEFIATKVLECSNLPRNSYIKYDICTIKDTSNNRKMRGCVSKDFLGEGDLIVTFYRILQKAGKLGSIKGRSTKDKTLCLIGLIKEITGVDVTRYLQAVFTLDAIILNEDRHLNNLALIYNKNTGYRYCPIFDNGLSLLSDVGMYPFCIDTKASVNSVVSKTFGVRFETQLAVLGLGFSLNKDLLFETLEKYNTNIAVERAIEVLKITLQKYKL